VLWGYLASINWSENLRLHIPAYAAVSVELIHKASLLLDDWIDGDVERHGEQAFHIEYGEHIAVMTAMKMVAESINHLLRSDNNDDIKLSSISLIMQTASSMTNGVLSELALDNHSVFNLKLVKRIAQLETSEIIGNAFLAGYSLGNETDSIVAMFLKQIGDLSGYLFQTLNDLESFSNAAMNRQHKGKENFDFNRNRKNIVIAYMNSILPNNERNNMMEADLSQIIHLYRKHKIEKLILREMELVFTELCTIIQSIAGHGVSDEWVEGFSWFINILKQVAYKRVMK
jgi:heptaprenyl diphosphate synthase